MSRLCIGPNGSSCLQVSGASSNRAISLTVGPRFIVNMLSIEESPRTIPGVIQIKAEATGKRAALLIELRSIRDKIRRLHLRADQIAIMLREEDYDGQDLLRRREQKGSS